MRILLLLVLLAGCDDDGTSIEHACKQDSDCPDPEMKCVVPAGVCVGFATPLEAVDAAPRSDAAANR